MINNRIMILSKEESVCIEMSAFFRESHYSVIWCTDYEDAIRKIADGRYRPDLFLFDITVPTALEYELIRSLKEFSDVRTILLSEDARLESQLYAYSMLIDDYMVKPAPYPLIEAHIESILRREVKEERRIWKIGALTIDYDRSRIYLGEESLTLTAMEFSLMDYFMKNKGVILTRDKILDAVWGYDYVGSYRSVDTLVKKLRAKLGKDHPYIRTVYGVGYCFDV